MPSLGRNWRAGCDAVLENKAHEAALLIDEVRGDVLRRRVAARRERTLDTCGAAA